MKPEAGFCGGRKTGYNIVERKIEGGRGEREGGERDQRWERLIS